LRSSRVDEYEREHNADANHAAGTHGASARYLVRTVTNESIGGTAYLQPLMMSVGVTSTPRLSAIRIPAVTTSADRVLRTQLEKEAVSAIPASIA
jgi:hypothetical protein